jgi:type II secretory pathway component PulF
LETDLNSSDEHDKMSTGGTAAAEVLDDAATIRLDALKLRLAAMVAPLAWKRAILATADEVDQGTPVEQAFLNNNRRLAREFASLIEQALNTPDPTGLVLKALVARKDVGQSWREFAALITYPLCLFVFAIAVATAFSFVMQSMVDLQWLEAFGLASVRPIINSIEDQHHAIVGLGLITAWMILVLFSIAWVGPAWAWLAVVGGMLVVGRPLRWINLRELLDRLQLFVSQGLDTTAAASAVSRSFVGGGQAVVAKAVAERIEAGTPLGKSLGDSMLADGLCRPALLMLDCRQDDLSDSLANTSELIGRLTEQRCRTLATILPAFVLVLVGSIIWAAISAYFQALTPLITAITALA